MKNNACQKESLTLYLASSIHEIKNAFARMQYLTDEFVLKLPEKYKKAYEQTRIHLESKHISTQLSQLLITYKHNETEYSGNPDSVIIEDYLEEIKLRHQETLEQLKITLEIKPELDLIATFDENLITNVIDTLIYNAIQAKANTIHLSVNTKAPFIEIQVEDNGPGFDQDTLDALNSNEAIDPTGNNTGLGLLFAKRISQMHQVKDRQGYTTFSNSNTLGGACVTLCVPV